MVSSDPSIKAVIFDYGGVLTTQGRVAINAWTRAERIKPETFSAALKEWLSRSAPSGTPIHRLETGEISGAEFDRLLAARLHTVDDEPVAPDGLMARMFSYMRPDDAMHRLVADLREAGQRTALLSNSWGNNYPWDTLNGLFELAVISSEVGLRKPDPRIYELTLDRLGLRPQEAVFVDDGAPNIEAAEELGLRGVLHTDAAKTRAELGGLLPRLGPDIAEETE
ncbi:HAD family phosphatase [Saccharopolyspora sp. NFXS83]|uniref:HAD family hydrolase n=1 Tax=Saccharopolyspora sp. NFXS83 TaxID=2993560 RepID=UPI00224B0E2E|nr:HAD family phosphatase [Saccharopolyspora sp. NFXS83]MCX2729745.1 HAD family phosphatase [Saccharopolyspora sp. NFXS83]